MKTKDRNIWKERTIYLSVFVILLIIVVALQLRKEETQDNQKLCSIIQGTPAWVGSDGLVVGYGVIDLKLGENAEMNSTMFTDYLIKQKIKFLYSDSCYYCNIQKEILGEENIERLKEKKLMVNCGEEK